MNTSFYNWLTQGWAGNGWKVLLIVFLAMAYLTILSVTIFLHRSQAHRGVDLHPLISHPMRFWLWLTTAIVTKEWVAIHRKHHAHCETEKDPHSPRIYGIRKVALQGVQLYMDAKKDRAMIEQFGCGTPQDWLERNLYTRYSSLGPALLLITEVALFGVIGITVWALQMLVIPILAAGIVNGIGHWWGYRNFETDDTSTNLTPWGILLGGEELHNNHHAFPSSARFALRRFEFDMVWELLNWLQKLGLAKIRRVAPKLDIRPNIAFPDSDTLRAVLAHRYQLMRDYFRGVVLPILREETHHAGESLRDLPRRLRRALKDQGRWLDSDASERLHNWISSRPRLATVYEFRQRLRAVYERGGQGSESMLEALRQWCHEAEASGIRVLEEFSARLKGYVLVPVAAR